MEEKATKRFEAWEEVDCNECARYWDDSCDGITTKDSHRPCNAFIATRSIVIPAKIKALESKINWLNGLVCMETILILLLLLGGSL